MTTIPSPEQILAACDRIDAFFTAWDGYLGHWASDFIASGPSNEDPELNRPDLLTVLTAARAAAQAEPTDTCPATGTSAFSGEPLDCVLPAEPAHDWHRTTRGANWSPNVTAAVPAAALPPGFVEAEAGPAR